MRIQEKCYICGADLDFQSEEGQTASAACIHCGASPEESAVAHMLVKYAGGGEQCLQEAVEYLEGRHILNIGYAGLLHHILEKLECYQFRETAEVEELETDYFDFIISGRVLQDSAQLQSVPRELDRIMAPQGVHLFLDTTGERIPLGEGKSVSWQFHDFQVIAMHKKMSEKAEFSGERFVPGIEDQKLTIEHMQRYQSVGALVQGKNVIDIACGEGYGTAILAEFARNIVGIDIDAGAVQRANEQYHMPNLAYQTGDIAAIPAPDHSVDVIVSFETIEHVSQELQQKFLVESKRVLKADGMLIISTPNKAVYSDKYHYFNEFHVHEFYHDEYLDFLHGGFAHVKLYNQAFEVVSLLSSCEGGESAIAFQGNGHYSSDGKYYIAVASNEEKAIADISSAVVGEFGEYEAKVQRIVTLQKEEEKRNRHIQQLDQIIQKNDQLIRDLQIENEQRGRHIQQLDRIIEKDDRLVQVLQHDVNRLENQIEQERLELQQRYEREKQELRDDAEREKQELRDNAEHERQELIQQIRNKEGHIELLLETEREFERYKLTRGYRNTIRNRKIIDFLLPPNSKRLFILRVIKRMFTEPKLMRKIIHPTYIFHYIKYLKSDSIEEITHRYEEIVTVATGGQGNANIHLEFSEEKPGNQWEKMPEQKLEDYEMLCFTKQENPIVSIVIPVYNQFDFTYNCLKSILKNSGEVAYEVIIANDCSTDITKDMEQIVKNVRLITTKENVRFLLNCNYAAGFAGGKYILFLNNDTQVQENWLQPLIDIMEARPDAGMVGSKLVYPDGKLQEAGGIVWKDASAWNYGHLKNPEDPEFNYVKEVDYISGAAIMIRTSLWKEIGGFDERFVPAYCEDSDLAFSVRKHGFKVLYQPLSVVVHFEGVSNGTDTNSGQKAYQVVNQQKFREKWENVLEEEHFPNAENVFWAKDRSRNKPVILMVDHYVPQYDKDAGSRTVFQYLKLFVDRGFQVKFIGDNFFRHEPYTTVLQQMGIEVFYGPYYAEHWKDWVKENGEFIQYAFLNRPHIAVKYIDYIKEKTKAKIIYYGHDLHFLREMRKYELTKEEKALKDSKEWKKAELSLMHKADVVYYPSEVEVREIAKIDDNAKAKAIVAYLFENVQEEDYLFRDRKDIMFVGGFTHTPNIDAVLWFVKEVFPGVLKIDPEMKFYIIGSNPPAEIEGLANGNVIVKGFVSDAELIQYYHKCRLAVVPLRYGAGIKGKVIEAMRYGIPVLTTSVGVEGITDAENILSIADDAAKLQRNLVQLYGDEELLVNMSRESVRYIQQHFSPENAWDIIRDDFQ